MGKETPIRKKITSSGIEITLAGTTLVKRYSRTYVCFMSFSTREEATKEFKKFRQGHKKL